MQTMFCFRLARAPQCVPISIIRAPTCLRASQRIHLPTCARRVLATTAARAQRDFCPSRAPVFPALPVPHVIRTSVCRTPVRMAVPATREQLRTFVAAPRGLLAHLAARLMIARQTRAPMAEPATTVRVRTPVPVQADLAAQTVSVPTTIASLTRVPTGVPATMVQVCTLVPVQAGLPALPVERPTSAPQVRASTAAFVQMVHLHSPVIVLALDSVGHSVKRTSTSARRIHARTVVCVPTEQTFIRAPAPVLVLPTTPVPRTLMSALLARVLMEALVLMAFRHSRVCAQLASWVMHVRSIPTTVPATLV